MPSPYELVAHDRTDSEIAKAIGADLVIFQTLPDLINSVRQFNPALKQFDCSVFSGEYVTGGVDTEYLDRLESLRNENAKRKITSELGNILMPNGDGVALTNGNGNGHTNGNTYSNERGDVAEVAETAYPSCNGPMNGADETIGLHNTWTATPPNELANRSIVS